MTDTEYLSPWRHPILRTLRWFCAVVYGPIEKHVHVAVLPSGALELRYVMPWTGDVWIAPLGTPLPEMFRPLAPGWTHVRPLAPGEPFVSVSRGTVR